MKKIFLTLSGFQITWLSCVFGEYYHLPLLGLFVGIFYLFLFFYFFKFKFVAIKLCLTISFIGYCFDSLLGFQEIFIIKSSIIFGYLPIWFFVLWLSFSTLFLDVLLFLRHRPLIAFLLGSSFAPPTYYFGIPLGIAESNNIVLAMGLMIIYWGFLLMMYSFYISKNNLFKNEN